jgi:hypothetical protein
MAIGVEGEVAEDLLHPGEPFRAGRVEAEAQP